MTERGNRFFRIREGELGFTLLLGFLLFSNAVSHGMAKVVAVDGFLSEVNDTALLLLVWAATSVLLIIVTGAQSLLLDKFERTRLVQVAVLVFALMFILLRIAFAFEDVIPSTVSYTLLYLMSDQQLAFFPILLWALASDIFDVAQGKRLFPLINGMGFIGNIIGLLVVRATANLPETVALNLLLAASALYFFSLIVALVGLRKVQIRETFQKPATLQETLSEGWNFIKAVPAFRYFTWIVFSISFVMTLLYFDMLNDAKVALGAGFGAFFSSYLLILALLAVVVQFLFASRLIEKIGLKDTFILLPIVMLGSTIWMIFMPGLVSSAGGQGVARTTYNTIEHSARKAYEALVPEERRGRVSIFLNSYLLSAGTIAASLIGFLIITFSGSIFSVAESVYSNIYLGLAAVISVFAIWSFFKMRKVYDESLLNWRLKRRQRRSSKLLRLIDKIDLERDER